MLKSKKFAALAIAIISFGAFLRFSWLTHQSLWYDEGISLVISDGQSWLDPFRVMWGRSGGDKYQPLYYTFLFAWRGFFGSSEYLLRTFSVLPGIGALVLVFLTAKRVYGKEHACWSALLMAVSAFCIYFSQEIRPFSLQMLLGSLQLYCFTFALIGDKKEKFLYSILFGLVTAINFFGGILLLVFSISIALSHFVALPKFKAWFFWWLPAAFLSFPGIIYFLASPAAADPSGDSTNGLGMPIYKSVVFVIHGLLVGSSYGPPLDFLRTNTSLSSILTAYGLSLLILFAVSLMLIFGVGFYYWRQFRNGQIKSADKFFGSLLFISFTLSALLALTSGINWMPRHSFFVYLPLCILLPLGVNFESVSKETRTNPWTSGLFKVSLLALVGLNLFSTANYFFDEAYWRDDYRSAAHYLVENQQPGEASILLWGTERLLDYYGAPQTSSVMGMGIDELRQVVESMTDQASVVYLLVNREFAWTRQNNLGGLSIPEAFSDLYTLESQTEFINFNIYRLKHLHS